MPKIRTTHLDLLNISNFVQNTARQAYTLYQGRVRGQHFRGQCQPVVFKAKDLKAKVEVSDLCDEGYGQVWHAQKVWNPRVYFMAATTVAIFVATHV